MRKYFYLILTLSIVSCSINRSQKHLTAVVYYSGLFKKGSFEDSIVFELEQDSTQWKVYFTSLEQNANEFHLESLT